MLKGLSGICVTCLASLGTFQSLLLQIRVCVSGSGLRWTGCTSTVYGTNGRDRSNPKRTAEIDLIYRGSTGDAALTSAMTSSPAAARDHVLAGERRRGGANGGHLRVEDDAANSPSTWMTANDDRRRRRRG